MRLLITLLLLSFLAACNQVKTVADDDYQFGDTTKSIIKEALALQSDYCTTVDPIERAALLTTIRLYAPGYPPTGICSSPLQIIEYLAPKEAVKNAQGHAEPADQNG